MKKILMGIFLSLMMTFGLFTQETDNTYWYNEIDVDGRLLTYYFCKTDTQFDNTFKDIVKEQLEIKYSSQEPNWNTIKSSWVSKEYIKKNFPKFYESGIADNNTINWDNYKYCWCIQNINDAYFINIAKRVNDTVYISLNMMYGYYQWAYTLEMLSAFENQL